MHLQKPALTEKELKYMKKRLFTRILLGVLILLNLCMIYGFSGESAEESGKTSELVVRPVAGVVVEDFTSKPQEEQDAIVAEMQLPIRKLAHMAEFGSLALLILLLLRTWQLPWLACFEWAMLADICFAAADELYQHLAGDGRCGTIVDVLIDSLGGLIACLLLLAVLAIRHLVKKKKERVQ